MTIAVSKKSGCEESSKSVFTWEEVQKNKTRDSCWIVVNGDVYDVTHWLPKHPGGEVVIIDASGTDATDLFNAYHGPKTRKMLAPFKVGRVTPYEIDTVTAEFRDLAARIETSELMEVEPTFYVKLVLWYFALLGAAVSCVINWPENFVVSVLLGGLFMGAFLQQVAFFGHDLGHTAVFHNRNLDSTIGILFGNALSGVSVGWWKATHNTHHCNTNSVSGDPDIQHVPFLAISSSMLRSFFSTYHERTFVWGIIGKFLIPLQSRLYYVIMSLARFNLYAQSYLFLLRGHEFVQRRVKTHRALELGGLFLFFAWFLYLLSFFSRIDWMLWFIFVSHAIAGILHVQITLSHFSMPVYEGGHPLGEESFLQHQLNTCLDIDCPGWLDWVHGGLQFQLCHHLFPRVPRCKLRNLQEVIKCFCQSHGLEYHHMGFVAANKKMIARLDEVGHSLSFNEK